MKRVLTSVMLLLLLQAGLAFAAPVIDQNQPNVNLGIFAAMTHFHTGPFAQSFMQSSNNISGAGILLSEIGTATENVTIALWDALPTKGGTLLTSGTAAGTAGNWVDVFWTPYAVTPDTTYYLVFSSDVSPSLLSAAGDMYNPYPRGQVFSSVPNNLFKPYPDGDYTFRTYTDKQVPEPATVLLVGLGLMGFAGIRTRITR